MILGITPARGSSKEIPSKNIISIGDKPLIGWTIEAAKQAICLDRYIVSTEDSEIKKIALACGADVLDRPPELGTDEATTLAVMQQALETFPADIVVLLQATSPVRRPGLIDECVLEFIDNTYDSLATGFFCHYVEYGKSALRRQEIEGFFHDDGNVYVIRGDLIIKGDRYGINQGRKVLTQWESQEIDSEFDLWLVEKLLVDNNLSNLIAHAMEKKRQAFQS